ncbi:MAG TPA: chitobiase/beta-hexosaminidase C-terminal domain-containing protein [Catalimonadaceae bacterium]|nr:chitobiase/beta-hexosaminidase C-terminal domain-containing protein [Catalimonadaceae bacterium]
MLLSTSRTILLLSLMVLSPFVQAQVTPSWVNQVKSKPTALLDPSYEYKNLEQIGDVVYKNGQVYSCGRFSGARGFFGSITKYADTSKLYSFWDSTKAQFFTPFISCTDNQGNYLWVKTLTNNQSLTNGVTMSMVAVRLCSDPDGNIYVSGSSIYGDSVKYDGQLIFTDELGYTNSFSYLLKVSPSGQLLWSKFWVQSENGQSSGEAEILVGLYHFNNKIHVHNVSPGLKFNGNFYPFGPTKNGTIRFRTDGTFDGAGPLVTPMDDGGELITSSYNPKSGNFMMAENLIRNPNVISPAFSYYSQLHVYDSTLALKRFFKIRATEGTDTAQITNVASVVEDQEGNIIGTGYATGGGGADIWDLVVNNHKMRIGYFPSPNQYNALKFMFRISKDGCLQWVRMINETHDNGLLVLPNGSIAALATPTGICDCGPFVAAPSMGVDSTSVFYYDVNGIQTGQSPQINLDYTIYSPWSQAYFGSFNSFSRMSPTPDGFVGSYGRGFFRFQYPTYPPAGIDSVASISANGPLELCQGNSVTLTASNGTSYEWTPGSATTQSITVTQAGTYQVKIGLPGGCYGYTSVIVKVNAAPSVNAGPNRQAVMNTGNLQLAGTPAGGTWSGSGISPTGSFSTIVSPGTYGVRYDVTSGSCTASDSTFILILPMISEGVQSPVASVQGGTYSGPQNVTLSSATTGAQIYYTTSGNVPKVGTGFTKLYTGPVAIIQNTTLKAIAMKDGEKDSPLMTQVYTIQNPGIAGTPVISPANGTFSSIQLVTITSSTPGADIYFTTNGNLPLIGTPNSFTRKYTTPFAVSQTTTIKAIAIKDGILNSAYSQATLTFATPAVTQPVQFSPAPGLHAGPVSVTMSSATPEAAIYYTTNGNVPRTDIPNFFTRLYSSPLNLSVSTSIRAVAVKSGLASSSVALAVYTIGGGFREATDIESMEVYPNPTTGNVQVQLPASETDGILTVINLQGKELQRMELRKAEKETTLSLESYPAGLYRIQLRNASGLQSLTVMKQ